MPLFREQMTKLLDVTFRKKCNCSDSEERVFYWNEKSESYCLKFRVLGNILIFSFETTFQKEYFAALHVNGAK